MHLIWIVLANLVFFVLWLVILRLTLSLWCCLLLYCLQKWALCIFQCHLWWHTARLKYCDNGSFFGMRTVSRLDSSPTDTPPRTISGLTLPRRTLPWRTFLRLDISLLRHFPDRTFPWPDISLTIYFSEIFFFFSNPFLFVCTRIYWTVIESWDLDQL